MGPLELTALSVIILYVSYRIGSYIWMVWCSTGAAMMIIQSLESVTEYITSNPTILTNTTEIKVVGTHIRYPSVATMDIVMKMVERELVKEDNAFISSLVQAPAVIQLDTTRYAVDVTFDMKLLRTINHIEFNGSNETNKLIIKVETP